ncbi:MAG: hypothetical protein JNK64_14210 [Myxococcales bacterium]|nr:hypothetical protein [Myxococcales bacterium]
MSELVRARSLASQRPTGESDTISAMAMRTPRTKAPSRTPPAVAVESPRVTGWQWEATTLPLPDGERDGIAEVVSKAVVEMHTEDVHLVELDVSVGDGPESIVKVSNPSGSDSFAFEITRSRIAYRHEPVDGGDRDPRDHIARVASGLLRAVGNHHPITRRLLSAGSAYELKSTLVGRDHPNLERVTRELVAPLATRPWEAAMTTRRKSLERVDLKWAVDTEVAKLPTTLWFKVVCPANKDHSIVETTIVVQSSMTEERGSGLPSPNWALSAVKIHDGVWPTVTAFLTWLLRTRR